MKNLKNKLDEIRDEFLKEIERGNFKLSDVKMDGDAYQLMIEVNGLEQRCRLYIDSDEMFSYSIQDARVSLFNNSVTAPKILKESIEIELSEIRAERMAELMDEYTKLAQKNGQP